MLHVTCNTHVTELHIALRDPVDTEVRGEELHRLHPLVLLAQEPRHQPGDGQARVTSHLLRSEIDATSQDTLILRFGQDLVENGKQINCR